MQLATILAGIMVVSNAFSQTPHAGPVEKQPSANAPAVSASASPGRAPAGKSREAVVPLRYRLNRMPPSARQYYAVTWGVDSLTVKSTESGEIIRFTYRVLDPGKAKPLNDKRNEPSLVDPGAGVKLVVPSLEKVGKLRQSSTPEAGKIYWMAFSNKGGYVKPGHRVNVVIGQFRAEGLVVR